MAAYDHTGDLEQLLASLNSKPLDPIPKEPRLSALAKAFIERLIPHFTAQDLPKILPISLCAQLQPQIALETSSPRDRTTLPLLNSQLPAQLPHTSERERLPTSPAREEPVLDSPTFTNLQQAQHRKEIYRKRRRKAKDDLLQPQDRLGSVSRLEKFSAPCPKATTPHALVEAALKTCATWLKQNASENSQLACSRRLLSLCISHFTDYYESLPAPSDTRRRGWSNRTHAYQILAGGHKGDLKKIKSLVAVSKKYLQLAKSAGFSCLFQIAPELSNTWEKSLRLEDVTAISEALQSRHRSSTEDQKQQRFKLDFLVAEKVVGLIEQLGMKKPTLARSNSQCAKALELFVDFEALKSGLLKRNSRSIYNDGEQREGTFHDESSQHSQSTKTTGPAAIQSSLSLEGCDTSSTNFSSDLTNHQTVTPAANPISSLAAGHAFPYLGHNHLDVQIEAANIGQSGQHQRAQTEVFLDGHGDEGPTDLVAADDWSQLPLGTPIPFQNEQAHVFTEWADQFGYRPDLTAPEPLVFDRLYLEDNEATVL